MYPLQIRIDVTSDIKENVLEVFRQNPERYPKVLIGFEDPAPAGSNMHLHCFVLSSDVNLKNRKQNARNLLKKHQILQTGNGAYSISKTYTEEFSKIGVYAVKDGNFCYYGFTQEEIKSYVEQSYKKSTKTASYNDELKEIFQNYQSDENYDIEMLAHSLMKLYIKYDKMKSTNQFETVLLSQKLKKSFNSKNQTYFKSYLRARVENIEPRYYS